MWCIARVTCLVMYNRSNRIIKNDFADMIVPIVVGYKV